MDNMEIGRIKERMRTVRYPFGEAEVFFLVDSYVLQGNLYLGLLCLEEGNVELFADITTNLPGEVLEVNEAYLNKNFTDSHFLFLLENGIGKVAGRRKVGSEVFTKIAFDLDKLRELDPDGLERYLKARKAKDPDKEG